MTWKDDITKSYSTSTIEFAPHVKLMVHNSVHCPGWLMSSRWLQAIDVQLDAGDFDLAKLEALRKARHLLLVRIQRCTSMIDDITEAIEEAEENGE